MLKAHFQGPHIRLLECGPHYLTTVLTGSRLFLSWSQWCATMHRSERCRDPSLVHFLTASGTSHLQYPRLVTRVQQRHAHSKAASPSQAHPSRALLNPSFIKRFLNSKNYLGRKRGTAGRGAKGRQASLTSQADTGKHPGRTLLGSSCGVGGAGSVVGEQGRQGKRPACLSTPSSRHELPSRGSLVQGWSCGF